jgi:predicted DNA-binding ribbon-helix-helix protein
MSELVGGFLLLVIVVGVVVSMFQGRKKHVIRSVKGVSLTPVDWALLGNIAAKKRVSQSVLIAQIVKSYLQDRVDDGRMRQRG